MAALTRYADLARPHVLALFRAVVGFLFACHGASSLFGIFGGSMGTGATVHTGVWPYWYAAVIQLACGVLVLAGLITRPAALLASGSMAYAYFVEHQSDALLPLQNHGELSAMFSWTFLLLVFTGPGTFALDHLLPTRPKPAPAPTAS
ncbi:DoxX family protein [Actinomadura rupiterrae]|uniref:DoxX family protein n=1 Tax=Actinomadura rupiterrae TaxID=559627 RepID=UPI0020A2440B|nr:DoxX family protein [Actinomadura rupiterrae]MCP2337424.1 putative oxidoreductase [Actinomadura rupiterrae]